MVPRPVEVQELGIAGRTRSRPRLTRHFVLSGIPRWRGGLGRSLSSPSSRSWGRSLPSVREWVGPTRLSRRAQQLERTEGESELHHWLQGIGDWGHDSDGESSGIDHDVLCDFH